MELYLNLFIITFIVVLYVGLTTVIIYIVINYVCCVFLNGNFCLIIFVMLAYVYIYSCNYYNAYELNMLHLRQMIANRGDAKLCGSHSYN